MALLTKDMQFSYSLIKNKHTCMITLGFTVYKKNLLNIGITNFQNNRNVNIRLGSTMFDILKYYTIFNRKWTSLRKVFDQLHCSVLSSLAEVLSDDMHRIEVYMLMTLLFVINPKNINSVERRLQHIFIKFETWTMRMASVSYTHLTLPTICSV